MKKLTTSLIIFFSSIIFASVSNAATCGSSNGGTFSSAPITNLCATGYLVYGVTTVNNAGGQLGAYKWKCYNSPTPVAPEWPSVCAAKISAQPVCANGWSTIKTLDVAQYGGGNSLGNYTTVIGNCPADAAAGGSSPSTTGNTMNCTVGISCPGYVSCGSAPGYPISPLEVKGRTKCATPSNSIPNIPTLSGDTSGTVNTTTSNWLTTTDPDGDNIYYELDWDGNGTVDGTTGNFTSGSSVSIGHTYTTAGTYIVKARAVQDNDITKVSAWSPAFTISIGASFNCEAASFNPPLNIISNNSLLGVALNTGMRWYHNIFNNSNAACFRNTSGNNYFVPTKTQVERDAFMNNLPAGVTKGGF